MNRLLGILILVLAAAGTAPADEPVLLDIHEAVLTALEGNSDIRKERITLDAARRNYEYRAAVFLPSFDVSASLSAPSSPAAELFDTAGGISADLSFSLGAGVFSALRSAPLDLRLAELQYENSRVEITRSVKKAFYSLLILNERESLMEENIESVKARYEAAQYDWETGRVAEYEVLSARLSYLTLLPDLEDFRIRTASAREDFLRLLGLPPDTELELTGSVEVDIPIPERDASLAAAGSHGTIQIQELKKLQQAETLRSLYDRYYPTLGLGIGADFSFPDPGTLEWFTPGYGTKIYSLSISVDLADFLPFSPMAEGITAAGETLEKTDLDIADTRRDLAVKVNTLLDRLGKAKGDIEVYQFNLELTEEYYNIVKTEYEEGRQDILTLEEADLKRQQARVDLLAKKAAYIDLLIDLEYYTGMELIR